MDRSQWNERYRERPIWSGAPNAALVRYAPHLPHRRASALDLGCGEGADALWLASRGWTVTGVDWAGVALERARHAAAAAGADAAFLEGDITDALWLASLSPTGAFDLVTLAYVHPQPEDRGIVYAHLPGLLERGGHLVVITHDPEHGQLGLPGPDPYRLMSPDDIAAALALPQDFEVTVRSVERWESDGAVTGVDSVLVVHRPAS